MSDSQVRIFSLGDSALTVEFGISISVTLNRKAIALSEYFEQNPFAGFIEAVPAYASTTIFYDPIEVRGHLPGFSTAFEAISDIATNAVDTAAEVKTESTRHMDVPVHFDSESALDLEYVAAQSSISAKDVIQIFTSTTYRVFMLGFLPGFTYMGEVDERIATPRKESPRTSVPKGSVGIAGRQTGIYSLESPGGWQILGRTDVEMFTPGAETPSFLRPGDEVRFVAIR